MHRSVILCAGLTLLTLLALLPLTAQARGPARSSLRASVPRSPGLTKRIFGLGHPRYVKQALKQAKQLSGKQRNQVLMGAFRTGLRKGNLSVYSARKLSKAMGKHKQDYSLRLYARFHQPGLTAKQARTLAKATRTHKANNTLLRRFARARIKTGLSLKDTIRAAKGTTYVGAHNSILDAFKAHHDGKLNRSQLKQLRKARAVAGSSSSSSDDGYSTMNIGGMNMGGVSMGGVGVGGVQVGNMRVGGVNTGGVSFGGVNSGGFNY